MITYCFNYQKTIDKRRDVVSIKVKALLLLMLFLPSTVYAKRCVTREIWAQEAKLYWMNYETSKSYKTAVVARSGKKCGVFRKRDARRQAAARAAKKLEDVWKVHFQYNDLERFTTDDECRMESKVWATAFKVSAKVGYRNEVERRSKVYKRSEC